MSTHRVVGLQPCILSKCDDDNQPVATVQLGVEVEGRSGERCPYVIPEGERETIEFTLQLGHGV